MLEFLLFDKARAYQRTVTPREAHVELLNNAVSFAELTFDDDDAALALMDAGARVTVRIDDQPEVSGPIVSRRGNGPDGAATVTVEDDFRVFRNILWPAPTRPINSQTSEYRRYSGPTETVVKAAVSDLSTQDGAGWTVPASAGRGLAGQRVEFRFHPLVDKLVPLLNAANLSLTIRDRVVDVVEGQEFPRILTPDSGVLDNYTWSITAPAATRVVVGGEGEGTARVLQQFIAPTREADWGFIASVFKDSRMAQGVTDLAPDGAEALAEGAGVATLTADLIETSWFRFGTYRPGDRVRAQVGPVDVTETITQVVFDDTPDEGLTVTPHLGAIEDDGDSRMAKDVARLQARTRDLGSR